MLEVGVLGALGVVRGIEHLRRARPRQLRRRGTAGAVAYAAMDMTEAVREHESLFNDAVRAGDFDAFIATFAEDAVMTFDGVPVGPFKGRADIAAAYAAQPPSDTMTIWSIEEIGPDTAYARFDWDNGGSGAMQVRWQEGEVADLTISFSN